MNRCARLTSIFGLVAIGLCVADQVRACHVEYVLKENDTLQALAHQIYNDPAKWQVIYYANQDRLTENASLLRPGTSIRLPCAAGNAPILQDKPATSEVARNEPQDVIVPFHMTSEDGIGRKVGFIVARNARISVGARAELALMLWPNLEGLPPGPHAFHVHSNPNCGPDKEDGKVVPGLAAGPHLFLKGTGDQEGVTYVSHLGNLPNLVVAGDGTAKKEIVAPRLTLDDIRGRSIVIHANQDDASARQACGVVPSSLSAAPVMDQQAGKHAHE
jgi:Cu-Zn family superoxide dismutase